MTIAELQSEIGRLQSILHRKVAGDPMVGVYSESLFNALHHGVTKFKVGDRVRVPGAADILTIDEIVPGPEDVATFKEGGFWRTSELRMVNERI